MGEALASIQIGLAPCGAQRRCTPWTLSPASARQTGHSLCGTGRPSSPRSSNCEKAARLDPARSIPAARQLSDAAAFMRTISPALSKTITPSGIASMMPSSSAT